MINTLRKISLASKTKKPCLLHILDTNRKHKYISSKTKSISNSLEDSLTFSHYVNEFLLKDGIRKSNQVCTVTLSFVLVRARESVLVLINWKCASLFINFR